MTEPIAAPGERAFIGGGVVALAVAAVAGGFAGLAMFASSYNAEPTPFPFVIAGPIALLALIDAGMLFAGVSTAGRTLTAIVLVGCVLMGVAVLPSPLAAPMVLLPLLLAFLVFRRRVPDGVAAVDLRVAGLVVVGLGAWMAIANPDPLKPTDVRRPDMAGVAGAYDSADGGRVVLADGRTLGPPLGRTLYGKYQPDRGDLVMAGGPTGDRWFVVLPPFGGDGCFQLQAFGLDEGTSVLVRLPTGSSVGLRLDKASGFDPGGEQDGRFVGEVSPRLVAAALPGPGSGPGPVAVPPATGYFCLDAAGSVTRWNRGY